MKKILSSAIIFTFSITFIAVGQSQPAASPSPAKKRTVWVDPPLGSHIGGGYTDAGDASDSSKAATGIDRRGENPALAKALAQLNAQTGTVVQGYALISEAVALQTRIPAAKIRAQRSATGLSFGDLLVANSLAEGSGKSFNEVLAMKTKSGAWDPLAKKLSIDMNSIIARTRAASESVQYAESRNNRNREQNKHDNSLLRRNAGPPAGVSGG